MAKLTRSDKKQIEAILARYKTNDRTTMSAQDSIPFLRMYPDGICRVTDNTYSKTIRFADINYQLNTNDDKSAIFEGWCDFLNYFDSSIKFQLSFINHSANRDSYSQNLEILLQGDDFDAIRQEYTDMLKNKLAKGNNGLIKT